MPNGGPTPDCIHCSHFRGKRENQGPWICTKHMIRLAVPIRAFCSAYHDPEPNEQGDWLDQELNRSDLDDQMMYVWIDLQPSKFKHYPLIPISDYKQWTYDRVLDAVAKIADENRD